MVVNITFRTRKALIFFLRTKEPQSVVFLAYHTIQCEHDNQIVHIAETYFGATAIHEFSH